MQNEMRDRLIELIDIEYDGEPNCLLCEEASDKCQKCEHRWEYKLADHLIENGVIVPPCKVGDRLYQIYEVANHRFISDFPETVEPYQVVYKNIMGNYSGIPFEEIGKTVFLTKEEAEQKLKGGADNE